MHYSTILLDLDHTLFDTDTSEAISFTQTLNDAGIEDANRYKAAYQKINLALWGAVEKGEITPQQVRTRRFEQLVVQEHIDADPTRLADAFVAGLGAHGELYADAQDVLELLSGRASLALVTNGLSEVQRARIERLRIAEYFDAIVISAEAGVAKPGTEIFDLTFKMLNFPDKTSAVMVGDSLSSDIQGGTNYSIATCWYNPGGKKACADDRIDHEIDNLKALTEIVTGSTESG